MKQILFNIGKIFSYVFPFYFIETLYSTKSVLYTGMVSRKFKHFGKSIIKSPFRKLIGSEYIVIGDNVTIGAAVVLTAWNKHINQTFEPQISIGNGTSIGDECHITAINNIIIGNNVLMGKKITITDNSHGNNTMEQLYLPPSKRSLYSKGPVIIKDGVWIGDKVTILAGITIEENSIVGANSVVNKDILANCIAAGVPAKVIKKIG